MSKLARQLARIGKLPHEKNEFTSVSYSFSEYPEVKQAVSEMVAEAGFRLPCLRDPRSFAIQKHRFELQTHSRSVEEHTDDVSSGVYFGLMPVKRRLKVRTSRPYETCTVFNFKLGRGRLQRRLEVGDMTVFNPRAPHSLIYYGEETTLMLFCLVRARGSE